MSLELTSLFGEAWEKISVSVAYTIALGVLALRRATRTAWLIADSAETQYTAISGYSQNSVFMKQGESRRS